VGLIGPKWDTSGFVPFGANLTLNLEPKSGQLEIELAQEKKQKTSKGQSNKLKIY